MKGRTSLVSRFAASTAMLATTVVVLAIGFFVVTHFDFFRHAIRTSFQGFSLILAERIWDHRDKESCQAVSRRHGIRMIVTTPSERYALGPDGEPIDEQELLSSRGRFVRVDVTGPDGMEVAFFWDTAVFARAHMPLLVVFIVLMTLGIGVTYAFQVALLRPLQWLRGGVDAVSRGDFKTRVPVVRQDEIGEVARAFNLMTERVEQMMADRERLLGDVSHELRSPLARMKVALELLPESEKRESIRRDLREMESLISVLLERERLRARMDRLETEPVDLGAVTRRIVETFEGTEPGVVYADPDRRIEARVDADLIGVVIHNLVDNALKFSLSDSRAVEVSLGFSSEAVELVVSDDGPGVPEAEVERLFEPFVKLDPSRGHRSGYGLGLNLCQRIVEAYGGSIKISSLGDRGTRIRAVLPRPA